MTKEVMKQALEALKNTSPLGFNPETDRKFYATIDALEEALKQEQSEAVAWYYKIDTTEGISFYRDNDLSKPWEPLYTTPQQRKPLTDKQIDEIPFALFVPDQDGMSTTEGLRKFARAIEAAHGIKE